MPKNEVSYLELKQTKILHIWYYKHLFSEKVNIKIIYILSDYAIHSIIVRSIESSNDSWVE